MQKIPAAAPNSFALADGPNIEVALTAFLAKITQPETEEERIFPGNLNHIVLPNDDDYVIFTPLQHIEHGTPVTEYSGADAASFSASVRQTVEVVVQVDFYNRDSEIARLRAESLHTFARTSLACVLLAPYGFSSCYCEPPRDATATMDANVFVPRWTANFHLCYTHRVTAALRSFDSVRVDIFNADVRYPPKR